MVINLLELFQRSNSILFLNLIKMKTGKIILLSFIFVLFVSEKTAAQGTLQFNQVKLFDLASGTAQTFTVPAGKVWKIESSGVGSASCNIQMQNAAVQNMAYIYTSSASSTQSVFPMWLPSGFSGGFLYGAGCSPFRGTVSIIEFNVIP